MGKWWIEISICQAPSGPILKWIPYSLQLSKSPHIPTYPHFYLTASVSPRFPPQFLYSFSTKVSPCWDLSGLWVMQLQSARRTATAIKATWGSNVQVVQNRKNTEKKRLKNHESEILDKDIQAKSLIAVEIPRSANFKTCATNSMKTSGARNHSPISSVSRSCNTYPTYPAEL